MQDEDNRIYKVVLNHEDEYGAYVSQRVCEIIVAPADTVQFDRARDVPSSVEESYP